MAEERSHTAGHRAPRVDAKGDSELEPFDADEAAQALREWTRNNPHTAIAGAAAIGFLLGGGLTPKMLGAIGMMAARHYLKTTASELLDSLVPEEFVAMGKTRE